MSVEQWKPGNFDEGDHGMTRVEQTPIETATTKITGEAAAINAATAAWESEISEGNKLRAEIAAINQSVQKGEKLSFNPDERIAILEQQIHSLESGATSNQVMSKAAEEAVAFGEVPVPEEPIIEKRPAPFDTVIAEGKKRDEEARRNIDSPAFDTRPLGGVQREQKEAEFATKRSGIMAADAAPLGGVANESRAEGREAYIKKDPITRLADSGYRMGISEASETLPTAADSRGMSEAEIAALQQQKPKSSWISRLFGL